MAQRLLLLLSTHIRQGTFALAKSCRQLLCLAFNSLLVSQCVIIRVLSVGSLAKLVQLHIFTLAVSVFASKGLGLKLDDRNGTYG